MRKPVLRPKLDSRRLPGFLLFSPRLRLRVIFASSGQKTVNLAARNHHSSAIRDRFYVARVNLAIDVGSRLSQDDTRLEWSQSKSVAALREGAFGTTTLGRCASSF